MTDYGLVSVITPTYNSGRFIAEAIRSVQAQTYANWEMLITDDCSSDDTCAVVGRFAARDSRIRLFRLAENAGAGAARNNSIERARGRFIAFLDSDDRWLPEKLECQLAFMREKGCALSYASCLTCGEDGAPAGVIVCRRRETLFSMKCDDGMPFLTVMHDIRKTGKIFMPMLRKRQDWGFCLQVLTECRVACGIREPLAVYRVRPGSVSRNKLSLVKYNIDVYRKVFGYSRLASSMWFLFLFMPAHLFKKLRLRIMSCWRLRLIRPRSLAPPSASPLAKTSISPPFRKDIK